MIYVRYYVNKCAFFTNDNLLPTPTPYHLDELTKIVSLCYMLLHIPFDLFVLHDVSLPLFTRKNDQLARTKCLCILYFN